MLDFVEELLARDGQDALDDVARKARQAPSPLRLFGLRVAHAQFLAQPGGEMVASERHVSGEDRTPALKQVDGSVAGAEIDQRDDVGRVGVVIRLEHVFQREIIHVHDRRNEAGVAHRGQVTLHHLFADRDEQDVEQVGLRVMVEHLVIQVHVVETLGYEVPGFEKDRLFERLGLLWRQSDTFDDDRRPGHGGHDVRCPNATVFQEGPDRLGHGPGILDQVV